jgi:hypothetical protein
VYSLFLYLSFLYQFSLKFLPKQIYNIEEFFPINEKSLNESESEQGTSKDDSTKDSDSLLFIGEDFPDIGDK